MRNLSSFPGKLDHVEPQVKQAEERRGEQPGVRSVGRSAAVMSLGTSLSRVTGYLRVAALAYALGVSRLADSYQLANVMPNMVFELVVGGVLSSVMIPVFIEYLVAKKKEEAWLIASAVTNISLAGLLALSLLAIAFPGPLVATQTFLVGQEADKDLVTFFFRFRRTPARSTLIGVGASTC